MNNKKLDVQAMTEIALIVAIILLMAFTPIGYIKTPLLNVTLITIPVAIGAIMRGVKGGAICGLAFGLTSLYTAMTAPSAMMGAFMMVSPLRTAVLCLVPRVLEGILCALIFQGLRKTKLKRGVSYYIAGVCCPVLNTLFFMTTLCLLFYNCDFVNGMKDKFGTTNPVAFVIAMVGIQAVIEAVVCGALAGLVSQGLSKALKRG